MLAVFSLTLVVSAFLLFLVQPMVAKMVLPLLGGTPAVWTTCMVFFQAALLAGYSYAHLAPRWLGVRRHALWHLAVLALPLALLPIGVAGWVPPTTTDPVPWLLTLLLATAGLPFFVVSTTTPLLQRWFASTGHRHARDPYFLYAASNLGSMTALLSYPVVVEPLLRLPDQGRLWAAGYALLVALVGLCALLTRHMTDPADATPLPEETAKARAGDGVTAVRRLGWVAWSFVPSSLLLGVTTYITTDIAPVPLLWIIPLVLYLLSFILVFSRMPAASGKLFRAALPVLVVVFAYVGLSKSRLVEFVGLPSVEPSPPGLIALHLAAFFVACVVCHGQVARLRPQAGSLTEYYFWLSLGGVLGGLFNAIVAPLAFNRVVEYPLLMAAPFLLWALSAGRRGARVGWAAFGLTAAAYFALSYGANPELLLHSERTFFGVLQIWYDPAENSRQFGHGTTIHGLQFLDPRRRREPTCYYAPYGPLGGVFDTFRGPLARTDVGVIGLGVGAMAGYAEPGQRWTFYEINPAVERIARDIRYFTFLQDALDRGVDLRVVLGDARLQLEHVTKPHDLLVVDAFNSDVVPIHLITRQALRLYLDKVTEHGVLAFHIASRFVRLAQVLTDLAADAGLVAYLRTDVSEWVVMARRDADLHGLTADRRWQRLEPRRVPHVWTDDYSNLLGVFIWKPPDDRAPSGR